MRRGGNGGGTRRGAMGAVARWGAFLAACAGFFAAAVLAFAHLRDLPVPCGASRGCAAVASHPSSRVAGVPIAYAGVAAYMVLIPLSGDAPRSRRSRRWATGLAGAGTIVSAVLLAHSLIVINAICAWCIGSGASMAATLLMCLLMTSARVPLRPIPSPAKWAIMALVAAGAGAQAGWMERISLRPPVPPTSLARLGAADLVDSRKSLGPDDAPITIVMFADFGCPACRRAYHSLTSYRASHPESVRLVLRHLPLWSWTAAAAALSEIAAERGQFWEFADAVHAGPGHAGAPTLLSLLEQLGCDAREATRRVAEVDDPAMTRLARDIALAESLGIRATPAFIILIEGQPPASASLRGLPRVLNSPPALRHLALRAAGREKARR
jgi:uncharacterized membrane protein/predicted DsbA family dithiol-disulfide isomerase